MEFISSFLLVETLNSWKTILIISLHSTFLSQKGRSMGVNGDRSIWLIFWLIFLARPLYHFCTVHIHLLTVFFYTSPPSTLTLPDRPFSKFSGRPIFITNSLDSSLPTPTEPSTFLIEWPSASIPFGRPFWKWFHTQGYQEQKFVTGKIISFLSIFRANTSYALTDCIFVFGFP